MEEISKSIKPAGPGIADWETAKNKMYAILRDERDSWLLPLRVPSGSPTPVLIEFPFVSHLIVRIGLDLGSTTAQVSKDYLEAWKISAEVALEQARSNFLASIANQIFSWTPVRQNLYSLKYPEDLPYVESLLLFPSHLPPLPELSTDDDALYLLTNRGTLLAAKKSDKNAVSSLFAEYEASKSLPGHLYPIVLTCQEGVIRAAKLEGADLALQSRHQKISQMELYNAQRDLIKQRQVDNGEEESCATVNVIETDDGLATFSTWTETVATLLPETDYYVVNRLDARGSKLVPKRFLAADVKRICGHRMVRTEHRPPRYKVNSFPDAGEYLALLKTLGEGFDVHPSPRGDSTLGLKNQTGLGFQFSHPTSGTVTYTSGTGSSVGTFVFPSGTNSTSSSVSSFSYTYSVSPMGSSYSSYGVMSGISPFSSPAIAYGAFSAPVTSFSTPFIGPAFSSPVTSFSTPFIGPAFSSPVTSFSTPFVGSSFSSPVTSSSTTSSFNVVYPASGQGTYSAPPPNAAPSTPYAPHIPYGPISSYSSNSNTNLTSSSSSSVFSYPPSGQGSYSATGLTAQPAYANRATIFKKANSPTTSQKNQ